jgi:hypothetical protein
MTQSRINSFSIPGSPISMYQAKQLHSSLYLYWRIMLKSNKTHRTVCTVFQVAYVMENTKQKQALEFIFQSLSVLYFSSG